MTEFISAFTSRKMPAFDLELNDKSLGKGGEGGIIFYTEENDLRWQ
jgi:hypothetical protein